MPRRPAKVTQADIARVLRAAKEAGASSVIVDPEGAIRIARVNEGGPAYSIENSEQEWAPSEALQRYLKHTESG
jgi:hypothetical protein